MFLILFLSLIRTSVSSYQSHDFKGFALNFFFSFSFDYMCKSVYTALEIGKLYFSEKSEAMCQFFDKRGYPVSVV